MPFKGDHDDITAGETFIWESPARWATAADVPSARFFAIFGSDTRESRFPGGNLFATSGWSDYQGVSSSCDAGIRLSEQLLRLRRFRSRSGRYIRASSR